MPFFCRNCENRTRFYQKNYKTINSNVLIHLNEFGDQISTRETDISNNVDEGIIRCQECDDEVYDLDNEQIDTILEEGEDHNDDPPFEEQTPNGQNPGNILGCDTPVKDNTTTFYRCKDKDIKSWKNELQKVKLCQ